MIRTVHLHQFVIVLMILLTDLLPFSSSNTKHSTDDIVKSHEMNAGNATVQTKNTLRNLLLLKAQQEGNGSKVPRTGNNTFIKESRSTRNIINPDLNQKEDIGFLNNISSTMLQEKQYLKKPKMNLSYPQNSKSDSAVLEKRSSDDSSSMNVQSGNARPQSLVSNNTNSLTPNHLQMIAVLFDNSSREEFLNASNSIIQNLSTPTALSLDYLKAKRRDLNQDIPKYTNPNGATILNRVDAIYASLVSTTTTPYAGQENSFPKINSTLFDNSNLVTFVDCLNRTDGKENEINLSTTTAVPHEHASKIFNTNQGVQKEMRKMNSTGVTGECLHKTEEEYVRLAKTASIPHDLSEDTINEIINSTNTSRNSPSFICDPWHLPATISIGECEEMKNSTSGFMCMESFNKCQGRCGKINYACSCDVLCGIYDTCCDDFFESCPEISKAGRERYEELLDSKYECLRGATGYPVISRCPESTNNTDKMKCEASTTKDTIPVYADGIDFKNIYCLRCNGFNESSSQNWRKYFLMRISEDIPNQVLQSLNENILEHIMNVSVVQWSKPSTMIRKCSPKMIGDCPDGTKKALAQKCRSSKADVYVFESGVGSLYRNRYCAECNVVSDYICTRPLAVHYNDWDFKGPNRFSSLLGVQQKSQELIIETQRPFFWKMATCSLGLDGISCTLAKCTKGYHLVNNTCRNKKSISVIITWQRSESNDYDFPAKFLINRLINFTNRTDSSTIVHEQNGNASKSETVLCFEVHSKIDEVYIAEEYRNIANETLFSRGYFGLFKVCIEINNDQSQCSCDMTKADNFTITRSPSSIYHTSSDVDVKFDIVFMAFGIAISLLPIAEF